MNKRNPYYDPTKAHHTPTGFQNSKPLTISVKAIIKWQWNRHKNRLPHAPKEGYAAFAKKWLVTPDLTIEQDCVWWLGHATLLFKLGDQHVLTDPLFSNRSSPFRFIGPKRKTPAPLSIEQLPMIDSVLISHNHYDHLDKFSIVALAKRFPDIRFFVPLGLKKWFTRLGIQAVFEMDWWDAKTHNGITITSVPAQHWSRRTFFNINKSLWCGFVITYNNQHYYFAGDTAFSEQLAEIGQRFPINMGFIPIGAYAPKWFMQAQHIDPHNAIKLHQLLNCERSMAIHFGAFELADDALDDAPCYLIDEIANAKISQDEFILKAIGSHLYLSASKTTRRGAG